MATTWPKHILVALDASRESLDALDRALELARVTESAVFVVHAVGLLEEGGFGSKFDIDPLLETACERTGCPPDRVVERIVEDGRSVEVILRVAEQVDADLIVLGRRGVGQALHALGSASAAVIERASVPVLVVSPI